MLLTLFFAVLLLAFAVYLVADAATLPSRLQQISVSRAARYGRARARGKPAERPRFQERVLQPAIARLAALALRLNPKATVEGIGSRLLAAGLSARITPTQFLALKCALAIGGVFVALLSAVTLSTVAGIVFTPMLAALGYLFPDAFLTVRTRARREHVRAQLPDVLDLLAVSVEAGLGFDGAVTKLTEHMRGPLVDEFALALGEIRIGETRHEALRKLTERVPAPEVGAFVRAVIQADQLGISLGRILRVQAADSRLRRQAAAEERAMKAPIKMLFPTCLFIFPAMFVVILGPALLNLNHYLK
jgi:tight adherence protein C